MVTTPLDALEDVFKALADKTRLRILALLGGDEVCVCHIHDALGLPQPTVSRHLAYLRRAGVVDARRNGVWIHYKVSMLLDPVAREIVAAAVHALTHVPSTGRDRKQFLRVLGPLHASASSSTARARSACCAEDAVAVHLSKHP